MKRSLTIGSFLLLAVLTACNTSVVEMKDRPCRELEEIDSLMWNRPDSAFAVLQEFLANPKADSLDEFERCYCQLLISELLYKNDYEQTNRAELLEAVAYYDSVSCPFLAARAHYINGVGYYETDSIVPACKEYMTALEIMEERFPEKELVGQKAKFMALAYTHVCALFSDQYLHEQAICYGKQSLLYYYRHNAEPWQIAWVLDNIGLQYDMIERYDSADYYYQLSLTALPDTNNLTYRDVATCCAFLSYKTGGCSQVLLNRLRCLLKQAESKKEYYARCLSIGEIFYKEVVYDSALVYLKRVFDESTSIDARKQAAEWLVEICKFQGKNPELYAEFLVPFANKEENKSAIKSQLTELYKNYFQKQLERQNRERIGINMKRLIVVFSGLLLITLVLYFLYHHNKLKKRSLEIQIEEERQSHRMRQVALGGRLKRNNLVLKELITNKAEPLTELSQQETSGDYAAEAICQHIISICNDKENPIKSTVPVSAYADIALNVKQKAQLKEAAFLHYGKLFENIKKQHPSLKEKDFLYCYLCLLGLNNVQISVLLQNSISTIWSREKRIQAIFGKQDSVAIILNVFLNS